MNHAFIVDQYTELLVLHRVFREAKFCIEPDDDGISASQIVADMFERLLDILIDKECMLKGEICREKWTKWLTIDEKRNEWNAALRRAKTEKAKPNSHWEKVSEDERRRYVMCLLRPFIVSDTDIEKFISLVNLE